MAASVPSSECMPNPIIVISTFSELVPLSAGIYVRKYMTFEMKVFFLYIVISQVSDIMLAFFGIRNINNLWLTHIFVIVEYGFLMWLFASWQKSGLLKGLLLGSIPALVLIGILAVIFFVDVRRSNTVTWPVSSLMMTAVSAYTLIRLQAESSGSVFREPRFWISSAALLYFSSSLAVISLGNVIASLPREQAHRLIAIHSMLNLLANIGYAGGFLCLVPPKKSGKQ